MRALADLLRSPGLRHGLTMAGATVIAGGLDYAFNVLTGRWLEPQAYGTFIAVTALLQVLVHLTNVIRNVVAYYSAELSAGAGGLPAVGGFVRAAWRWAWRWGLLATILLALLSWPLATWLQLDSVTPLWAASLALLLLFIRPVTDGALQGRQAFAGLSAVQISQALLRLLLAILLIRAGLAATGAILALPLASFGALLLALWLLRELFGAGEASGRTAISWSYSLTTLLGLGAFALIINMDALLVKRLFSPEVAGSYGPVVTLGKMNLFVPLALGLVLFPKVTQRQALGQSPRPVLLLALAATLLPGLAVSLIYFFFPGQIVHFLFTTAYPDPGILLGLVGLATTCFAALNIWLNYALSLDQARFVYGLLGLTVGMLAAIIWLGNSLVAIAWVMVGTGLLGNLWGASLFLRREAA